VIAEGEVIAIEAGRADLAKGGGDKR